jgi:hypothetical protein
MIFFHKPYYSPNYINLNLKNILVIYALKPKNYTKYTNYIMPNIKIKKNIKKNLKPKFKAFELQIFTN